MAIVTTELHLVMAVPQPIAAPVLARFRKFQNVS